MISRLQKVRLGIFFLVSISALIILIGVIVVPTILQEKKIYYIGYSNLSLTGLQEGSRVKYHGLNVGQVTDISIDPNDIRRVIVELSLEPDVPIKKDTKADVTMLGITGLKVIELRGGTNESDILPEGGFIHPGKSITEMITGKAEVISEKAEIVLNNITRFTSTENLERVEEFISNASQSFNQLNDILGTNKQTFQRSLNNTEQITRDAHSLIVTTDSLVKKFNTLTRSDTVDLILGNLAEISKSLKEAELVTMINELNRTLNYSTKVLKEVDVSIMKTRSELGTTVETLKESVIYLNQIVRMISEDPSVLVRGVRPETTADERLEK
ncbi:MAG: MlaD family protein [bacterium]